MDKILEKLKKGGEFIMKSLMMYMVGKAAYSVFNLGLVVVSIEFLKLAGAIG